MTPPVLVTGGSGFVGEHLLDLLAGLGEEVVAWYRPGPAPRARPGVAWRSVDVLDRDAVEGALAEQRPARVYHLAAAANVAGSWTHAADTLAVNVMGTHRLLDAARRLRMAPRVLVTGSATVYRPALEPLTEESPVSPSSPYALSKLAQERLAMAAWADDGLPTLPVRAFNHVGPGQSTDYFTSSFARQVAAIEAGLAPPEIEVGNLDAWRDLTDVRDTVRAYVALMARGRPGVVYNVCSGRPWNVRAVLDFLVAAARVGVSVRVSPARLRPNDVPRVCGSFDRLARDTGWAPAIPLETTLIDVLDDWRRRLASDPASAENG